jgi:hypothetical protein
MPHYREEVVMTFEKSQWKVQAISEEAEAYLAAELLLNALRQMTPHERVVFARRYAFEFCPSCGIPQPAEGPCRCCRKDDYD